MIACARPSGARRPRGGPSDSRRHYGLLGALLIAPTVLIFCAVIVYPLVSAIYLVAVLDLHADAAGPLGRPRQLRRAPRPPASSGARSGSTSSGPSARSSCRSCFGVALALLLHQNICFRSLARSLILFPYFVSTVVAVLVWRWLFNDLYGILNHAPDVDRPHRHADRLARPDAERHGQRHPGRRLEVLPLRRDRRAGAPADDPRPALRGRHASTAPAPGAASATSRCRSCATCCSSSILLRAIWDFKEFDLIYLLTGGGPVDLDPDAAAARLQAGLRASTRWAAPRRSPC